MIVILRNIRSLHNVGSIFRTSDAVGVEKIYLCGITPAPIDALGRVRSQFKKVSLGAEKYVKWEKVNSATLLIKKLKNQGHKIFAIEQNKKAIPYYKIKVKKSALQRIGLVLGNEIKGLPPSILNLADKILEIPMRGKTIRHADHPKKYHPGRRRGKESLNVGVAFGIVAYGITHSS